MPEQRPLASPKTVADFLGLPVATLAQWRYLGKGPRSIKIGRHVRYRWADIEQWLVEHAHDAV
ncbi:helix-turn-helix domain-containing protein [Streptomyces chartreusis]|uniref:helix-turn-helix transcriptional regulator n=1 Tax=Streptomyces chartreusis TaxID=1969 RepID=UPI002E803858|nr:helix-turn-helix domain-containing protein [Streptomyces chartreusis]WUB18325.1 helix-turn-helix domain-containing protein [Streptomyces chartreusis]